MQTDEGEVIIPSSRRPDGSVRKTIRIRQGYIPQDEVAAYKSPAQRACLVATALRSSMWGITSCFLCEQRREQDMQLRSEQQTTSISAEQQLDQSMRSLSLGQATNRPSASSSNRRETPDTSALKGELTKINRQLKEITKIEERIKSSNEETLPEPPTNSRPVPFKSSLMASLASAPPAAPMQSDTYKRDGNIPHQQRHKLAQKAQLEKRRREIIAILEK